MGFRAVDPADADLFRDDQLVLSSRLYSGIPGTISYLGAFLYELAWAVGCQCWQVFYYNRYAARHPWQEAPPHSLTLP